MELEYVFLYGRCYCLLYNNMYSCCKKLVVDFGAYAMIIEFIIVDAMIDFVVNFYIYGHVLVALYSTLTFTLLSISILLIYKVFRTYLLSKLKNKPTTYDVGLSHNTLFV
jgi:hypothetical protein